MRSGAPLIKPPRFKPPRDRHVDVLAVACPSCEAPARTRCVRLDGQPASGAMQHPARRRMAIRAENLSQEAS